MANKQNINVEINKQAAGLAFLVSLISIGYLGFKNNYENPVLIAIIAGVVGFAIGYIKPSFAAIVILIDVVIFWAAYSKQ